MDFDGQALNRLYDWWQANGNSDIHIFLDYCGRLAFYDTKRGASVASVMRLVDGPCFLDCDHKSIPFTEAEYCQIAKFVRKTNADFYD